MSGARLPNAEAGHDKPKGCGSSRLSGPFALAKLFGAQTKISLKRPNPKHEGNAIRKCCPTRA